MLRAKRKYRIPFIFSDLLYKDDNPSAPLMPPENLPTASRYSALIAYCTKTRTALIMIAQFSFYSE